MPGMGFGMGQPMPQGSFSGMYPWSGFQWSGVPGLSPSQAPQNPAAQIQQPQGLAKADVGGIQQLAQQQGIDLNNPGAKMAEDELRARTLLENILSNSGNTKQAGATPANIPVTSPDPAQDTAVVPTAKRELAGSGLSFVEKLAKTEDEDNKDRATVYKLFRRRKDQSLGPLFINAKQRIPLGEWLDAEDHPTPGFAHRPGWHATFKPHAPHLKMKPKGQAERVWVEGEAEDTETYDRPESQGGTWVLAQRLRANRVMDNGDSKNKPPATGEKAGGDTSGNGSAPSCGTGAEAARLLVSEFAKAGMDKEAMVKVLGSAAKKADKGMQYLEQLLGKAWHKLLDKGVPTVAHQAWQHPTGKKIILGTTGGLGLASVATPQGRHMWDEILHSYKRLPLAANIGANYGIGHVKGALGIGGLAMLAKKPGLLGKIGKFAKGPHARSIPYASGGLSVGTGLVPLAFPTSPDKKPNKVWEFLNKMSLINPIKMGEDEQAARNFMAKFAAQDSNCKQRTAPGEEHGISTKMNPDDYMTGMDAWNETKKYLHKTGTGSTSHPQGGAMGTSKIALDVTEGGIALSGGAGAAGGAELGGRMAESAAARSALKGRDAARLKGLRELLGIGVKPEHIVKNPTIGDNLMRMSQSSRQVPLSAAANELESMLKYYPKAQGTRPWFGKGGYAPDLTWLGRQGGKAGGQRSIESIRKLLPKLKGMGRLGGGIAGVSLLGLLPYILKKVSD